MKKYFLLACSFLLICNVALAQNPFSFSSSPQVSGVSQSSKAAPEKPKAFAQFKFSDKNNTHDFGDIPEGPKVTYQFSFTNTGKEPLVISNAQASCGCTSPEFPKEPILPGKKGKISVTYSTQGRVGEFSKVVYLTSNAQNPEGNSRYELFIKGNVIAAKK